MDRRRIIIAVLASLATLVLIVLAWRFIQGSATVHVEQKDAVISLVLPGQEDKELGKGSATVRGPGEYTLHIKYDQSETLVTVKVERFKSIDKEAVLYEPVAPKLFYGVGATSFAVQGKSLRFINDSTIGIQEVNTKTNKAKVIGGKWPTPKYGVWGDYFNAFMVGSYGVPMVMSNNQLSYLDLNEGESDDYFRSISYPTALNSKHQLSMVFNGALRLYNKLNGAPKKLTAGLNDNSDVYLNDQGDTLYVEKPELRVEGDRDSTKNDVKVIDNQGQTIHEIQTTENDYIIEAAWSPSGEQMLWLTPQGLFLTNKPMSNTRLLSSGYGTVTSMVWVDENTVVYIADAQVWRANVNTLDIVKLSRPLEGTNPVGSIFRHNNKLYFSIQSKNYYSSGEIYEFILPTN